MSRLRESLKKKKKVKIISFTRAKRGGPAGLSLLQTTRLVRPAPSSSLAWSAHMKGQQTGAPGQPRAHHNPGPSPARPWPPC